MGESNQNEPVNDILASFEQEQSEMMSPQEESVSSDPQELSPSSQEPVSPEEPVSLAQEIAQEPHDQVVIPPADSPKSKKGKYALNEGDTLKMRFIVSLEAFLFFGLLYYIVVLMTVSGIQLESIGLTTLRFSQLHFILFVIYAFALARVFVHCCDYVGDRFLGTGALGTAAQTLSLIGLALVYIDHFNLGNMLKDLIGLLPF